MCVWLQQISEKRKYCKYKAAMILKAIKEGRAPTPGPPSNGMDGVSDLQIDLYFRIPIFLFISCKTCAIHLLERGGRRLVVVWNELPKCTNGTANISRSTSASTSTYVAIVTYFYHFVLG